MNLPAISAGKWLQFGLVFTSLIGSFSLTSTPASAQVLIEDPIADFGSGDPGAFAGVAVFVTPSAYLSTIAAETVAPSGTFFRGINGSGTLLVTATSYIDPVTHVAYPSLALHTGGLGVLPYDAGGGSIRGAVVERLRFGNLTLDEFTALVRAAVGNDGLE
ncbi:hypothetical protein CLI64_09740 [Nostoc sp. CENA543]|uniref:hypothetical protein n=1 Tax=Nostoc sp. CENA543 TaxID=1869241 RepID=UPI000CA17D56|nr:hypothetical protein [Nostoc sp. CENA543]AUT00654.1 hypothetical protein CLI64_09740 [Nostoc sp. CENA543]